MLVKGSSGGTSEKTYRISKCWEYSKHRSRFLKTLRDIYIIRLMWHWNVPLEFSNGLVIQVCSRPHISNQPYINFFIDQKILVHWFQDRGNVKRSPWRVTLRWILIERPRENFWHFNSLVPGRYDSNIKLVILKLKESRLRLWKKRVQRYLVK